MEQSLRFSAKSLPRSFVGTVLSVLAFSLSLFLGILTADLLQQYAGLSLTAECTDPYAGCGLLPEYVMRAAYLCQPTVVYVIAIWLAAYVRFENILLISLFSLRGLSLGTALRLSLTLSAELFPALYTGVYAVITLILLGLVFCMRDESGVRPFPDSLTAMMIAGGASVLLVVLTSLLPLFF